jgi:hypothetical protein
MADRTETERRPGTGENGAFTSRDGAPNGPPPLPKAKMPGFFEGEPLDGLWQYLYPKRFSVPSA